MLGFLLFLLQVLAPGPAPAARLPRPPRPVVAPTDTLVRVLPCPGAARAAVGRVLFAGNAITKERILRAELDFTEGDTLTLADLPARLEANRRRLFNLQLFHAVVVQASCTSGKWLILFGVQERWYTFPVPILSLADRNLRSWLDRPDRWRRVDYGLHLTRTNFRGRNEQLILNLQLGFNRKYELFYEAPGLGPLPPPGLRRGRLLLPKPHPRLPHPGRPPRAPARRRQLPYPALLRHGRPALPPHRAVPHRPRRVVPPRANQRFRQLLQPGLLLGRTRREFLDFTLSSTRNQRNTFAYPLTGHYAQASLTHRVFLDPGTPSLTTLRLTYSRYLALGHQFYYSLGLSGQTRLARALAYPDTRALGYDDLVRGYDQYVIDGRHYGLVQQGLSYRLFQPKVLRLGSITNPKVNTIPLALYGNIFADAGYVVAPAVSPQNRLPNHFLRAVGLGLHLVTYYDRVFTAEYTLNGLGQTGYFFRAEFPI